MAVGSWGSSSGGWSREITKSSAGGLYARDTYEVGPDSYVTAIVDMYASTDTYSASVGVSNIAGIMTSSATLPTSGNPNSYFISNPRLYYYNVQQRSYRGSVSCARSTRVAAAVHNYDYFDGAWRVAFLGEGANTSSNQTTVKYYRTGTLSYNTWVNRTGWYNGRNYYAITVNSNNLFLAATSFTVSTSYRYVIKLHTYSCANFDGIIVSSSQLTSGDVRTAGFTRCSGLDATVTYTYTPTASGTVYIYFKTDDKYLGNVTSDTSVSPKRITADGYSFGDVEVTRQPKVTINQNGGTGTVNSIYVNPYYDYSPSSIAIDEENLPPTRTGTNGIPFGFLGYYTSPSATGVKVISSDGRWVNHTVYASTGTSTYFAWWNNTISYDVANNTNVYCTSSAIAATTTQGQRAVTVAANGLRCASNETVTFARQDGNSTWLISSDGKTATVPGSVAYGQYSNKIIMQCTSPSKTTSSGYTSASANYKVVLTVVSTYVTSWGTVTVPSIAQSADLPASGVTLTQANVGNYFTKSGSGQTISYNNGSSRSGTIYYEWKSTSGTNTFSFSVPTKGTTYSSTHTNISLNPGFYAWAYGENDLSTYSQKKVSAYQEANLVTNVYVTPAATTISVSATTTATISAKYTSGSYRDIVASPESGQNVTIATNPTGVINVS